MLMQWMCKEIGLIASIDHLQWAPSLPKTRTGKIMHRNLRKIAADEHDQLGDIARLANQAVVEDSIKQRLNT